MRTFFLWYVYSDVFFVKSCNVERKFCENVTYKLNFKLVWWTSARGTVQRFVNRCLIDSLVKSLDATLQRWYEKRMSKSNGCHGTTFIKLVFITIFFSYFLNKLHHALMGYKQRWRRQMGVLELRKIKKSHLNTSKIHNEVLKAPSFGQTWIKKCKSARFMKIEGFFFYWVIFLQKW